MINIKKYDSYLLKVTSNVMYFQPLSGSKHLYPFWVGELSRRISHATFGSSLVLLVCLKWMKHKQPNTEGGNTETEPKIDLV